MNHVRAYKLIIRWVKKWNNLHEDYLAEIMDTPGEIRFKVTGRGKFRIRSYPLDYIFYRIKTETNIRLFVIDTLDLMIKQEKPCAPI